MPATEAEMVKYFSNTFYALKVAFANQMYDLCESLGIEYEKVKQAAAADKWIEPMHLQIFHKGYRGYGGKCLTKDIQALIQLAQENGLQLSLHEQVEKYNSELLKSQNISKTGTPSKGDDRRI